MSESNGRNHSYRNVSESAKQLQELFEDMRQITEKLSYNMTEIADGFEKMSEKNKNLTNNTKKYDRNNNKGYSESDD